MRVALRIFPSGLPLLIALSGLLGCSSSAPVARPTAQAALPAIRLPYPEPAGVTAAPFPVMLGIDVLEAEGFAPLRGKRIGLLTHPAGVNRRGVSTIDVLRRAPGVKLVALFGPEHGIYGDVPASENIPDRTDPRTGLPAYSLFGNRREPTKAQLKDIDVLVIDLQDIGVRSYSFTVCMKYAIEGCFKNGVEVMVLDRPNPLGGLKVDGPLLDENLKSGVGGYRVPYVHGLTIGEIARMAAQAPGVLSLSEAARERGKLTVIPMRGWRRSMRWPETGLVFKPTSPLIQDFPAVVGYAMVGLGTSWPYEGFSHGVGKEYPFRGISYKGKTADALLKELEALRIPGIAFRKVSGVAKNGQVVPGIYVDVTDWDAWRPTELSFQLMRLSCKLSGTNPFARISADDALLFNKHVGSMEWWNALRRDGARVNVEAFVKEWQARDAIYQQQTRKYWLYE